MNLVKKAKEALGGLYDLYEVETQGGNMVYVIPEKTPVITRTVIEVMNEAGFKLVTVDTLDGELKAVFKLQEE